MGLVFLLRVPVSVMHTPETSFCSDLPLPRPAFSQLLGFAVSGSMGDGRLCTGSEFYSLWIIDLIWGTGDQ